MELWEGMVWGAFGGFAMESLDFIIAVRRWRRLPWCVGARTLSPDRGAAPDRRQHQPPQELAVPGVLAYGLAGVLRVTMGCGLSATVVSTSPQAASAWVAVLTGAAAPLILEKITALMPLLVHGDRSVPVPDSLSKSVPAAPMGANGAEVAVSQNPDIPEGGV
ncbi:hypothetical protein ACIPJS_38245 [Streptomyces sp. NPDC086783]|uniref:hypothetical protein n=1 Tax=Streptomyces sp. NPDC086783 TaxID=3365758 RepID=UPI003830664B